MRSRSRLAPAAFTGILLIGGVPPRARAQQAALTVEQAVQEALTNNLNLLAQRANISIAQARVLGARLRPNPVVSVDADHLDLLGTRFNEVNGAGPQEYAVRTDFTIERGAKRARRVEVAEMSTAVAQMEFREAARQIALEVRSAAVEVLLAKANLELARENFAAANRIAEINAVRLKAGDIPEVELMRSRVAALEASNAVRRAELAVRLARTRLSPLLGRRPETPLVDIQDDLRRGDEVPPLAELVAP
jgi:cobalt-zinc-cadmium efflux system outer membrane protein